MTNLLESAESSSTRYLPIEAGRVVVALAMDWPKNTESSPHYHDRGQLLFASKGIMNVTTDAGAWVVPSQRAVWIPARTVHSIKFKTDVELRTVYIEECAAHAMPTSCCVIAVSTFLRELLIQAMDVPTLYHPGGRDERLMNLVIDELSGITAKVGEYHLPLPKDKRVQQIVEEMRNDPGNQMNLEDWSRQVGASGRTIQRIFKQETGMSFGAWKRQAILLEALRKLADGESVLNVSIDLGYSSQSAFTHMFRQTLGVTPYRFFK